MIRTSPKRGILFTRTALALAMSLGVFAAGFVAQPALAAKPAPGPKIEFSPAFSKVAAELDKTLSDAPKNAAVQAASQQVQAAGTNAQAKAAAVAQVDAALGGNFKAKLDTATAAASTPGDKLKLGEMTRTYGVLVDDITLQHQGLVLMLDSGVMPAAMIGQVQFLTGYTAYELKDYAGAAHYVQLAKDSGFQHPQLEALLSDSYKRSNNPQAALANAQRDIAAAKAAGTKPSEVSIRTALQAAYDAKQSGPSIDLAVTLVQYYPSQQAWGAAISVVRALSSYQSQEMLDLMRLMGRTDSYKDEHDYIEYLQAADPRRLPGEAQKVLDAGTAAGKLRANDPFIVESRGVVTGRLAADRASLPGLERDARAGNASAITAAAAADAFLSYGDAAKAEALYTIALGKSGVDTDRVLTRLGIAQVDQGKTSEAQANFAKIQGPRRPIAQLWSAYAAQKAGGSTVAH